MSIVKLITLFCLAVLPTAVLIRDWKYHDKGTKKHHIWTRTIIVFWCISSIPAIYFVRADSNQIQELIDGKDKLLSQNTVLLEKIDNYQVEIKDKEERIEELEKYAPRTISDVQRQLILNALKGIGDTPIDISITDGDSEAFEYARSIVPVLTEAGCRIGSIERVKFSTEHLGLNVKISSQLISKNARSLHLAIKEMDPHAEIIIDKRFPSNYLALIVGAIRR